VTGQTATLSISDAASTGTLNGFYIQSVLDTTANEVLMSGTYTPQSLSAPVGDVISVTLDNYGSYYVVGSNVGTFSTTTANGGGGTATLTLEGNTNLIFTMSTSQSTTTTSTTTSSTSSTSTTATTSSAPVTIKVRSVSLSGTLFTGMWTMVNDTAGDNLASGYTTFRFTGTAGTTYVVCVDNYETTIFQHWGGGSTNNCQTVTPTSNIVMTAYYSTG
jgi:hypothetical protein